MNKLSTSDVSSDGTLRQVEGGFLSEDKSMKNQRSMVGEGIAVGETRARSAWSPRIPHISRRRLAIAVTAMAVIGLSIVALIPADQTAARPNREGGGCDGCHSGAETPSMMTVTGLPTGFFVPGQQYTITVTITDTNGATGENAFDIIATAGTFTTTDPNAEINAPASGAEASSNDAVTPAKATTWTVVWTAPTSGGATIDVWSVMGDGATGTLDIWDHENYSYTAIPEFPTLLLPIIAAVGAIIIGMALTKRKS